MFQDVWYPLFEAFLNIGLSVLLGLYFGLNGILSGDSHKFDRYDYVEALFLIPDCTETFSLEIYPCFY